MQWSKLKQLTENKFAKCVAGRVELFSTAYRKPASTTGRGWITVDREEVVNFSTVKSLVNFRAYYHESTPTHCITHAGISAEERTSGNTIEGEFSRFDLHNCCWGYLSMTVEEGIEHKSPIINSLAILDKRMGKRRLMAIDKATLHPVARKLFEFRITAEKLITNQ